MHPRLSSPVHHENIPMLASFLKREVILVLLIAFAGCSSRAAVVEYEFSIENSWSNPDGFYRNTILMNGQFVGPTIRATTQGIPTLVAAVSLDSGQLTLSYFIDL